MDNKGQGGIEFLSTYAWAFIVMLMAIGALGYFGVLSPKNLLPDKCTFSSEFECTDWVVLFSKNEVHLRLRNNVGEPIVANISAYTQSTNPLVCAADANKTLEAAQLWDVNMSGCNFVSIGYRPGQKERFEFTLKYHTVASGQNYPHEVQGQLFSVISP